MPGCAAAISQGGGLPSVNAEIVDFGSTVEKLSLAVAIVLMATYVAGLVFSLRTHRDLFNPPYEQEAVSYTHLTLPTIYSV